MLNLKETRRRPPSSRGTWALPGAEMEAALVSIAEAEEAAMAAVEGAAVEFQQSAAGHVSFKNEWLIRQSNSHVFLKPTSRVTVSPMGKQREPNGLKNRNEVSLI